MGNFEDSLRKQGVQIYRATTTPYMLPCASCGSKITRTQAIAESQTAARALKSVTTAAGTTFHGGGGGLVAYFCDEHNGIIDTTLLEALRVEEMLMNAEEDW